MDDYGPVYNVRMRRGQGYNSYVQEPRIDNAVLIAPGADPAPTTAVVKPEAVTNPPDTAVDGTTAAKNPSLSETKTRDDFFSALLDRMSTLSGGQLQNPQDSKVLPYVLKPSPSARLNQTVLFSSKQVKTAGEIDKAMGFKASAAIKAGSIGPGAEAGSNLASSDDIKLNQLNFLIHVKVVNEALDKREDWKFQEVACLEERLRDKTTHEKAVEFTRIYGDTFISDFVEGGEIYAWVGIRSQDKEKVNELRAYASAQLTPMAFPVAVKADADFNRKKTEAFSQAETSIRIQWRGGGEIKNHDFQWGMDSLVQIANAFPSFVAITPAKIRAVLTPYSALKSFQDRQHDLSDGPLALSYDHCALYVSTLYDDFISFSEMCDEINSMIANPANYKSRVKDDNTKKKNVVPAGQTSGAGAGPGADGARTERNEQLHSPLSPLTTTRLVPLPMPAQLDSKAADATTTNSKPPAASTTIKETRHFRTLANIGDILAEPSLGLVPIEPEPQKLSSMRLLCRSAMIYIQEQAADLVIDPEKLITTLDVNGQPQYPLPQYPCPGTLRNLLPVLNRDTWSSAYNPEHFTNITDLVLPKEAKADPINYYWDPSGDFLSKYKSYQWFQIGNFELNDDKFPQAITIVRKRPSRVWKHVNKAVKEGDKGIGGIGFRYANRPSSSSGTSLSKLESKDAGKRQGLYTTLAGQKPKSELAWTMVTEQIMNTPPINQVLVYYIPGTGRISGIDFMSISDPDASDDEPPERALVASYREWETLDDEDPVELQAGDLPDDMLVDDFVPGDSYEDEENWMFAGLAGAFEKVGPFKTDLLLAKVAVIWKKKRGC
jgi:hypothetical protein